MNSKSGKLLLAGVAVCALMTALATPAQAGLFCHWGGYYTGCYTAYCAPCPPVACAPVCDPCVTCYTPCWRPLARLHARLSCCWGYCYGPCTCCDPCVTTSYYETGPACSGEYEVEKNTAPTMAPPEPEESDDPQASDLPATSGMIVLRVPADATVSVNGYETESTGMLRRYVSTDLAEGNSYRYEIEVRMQRDGRTVTENRTVVLTGGTERFIAVADRATNVNLVSK